MPITPEQWAATEGSAAREDGTEAALPVKQGSDRVELRQGGASCRAGPARLGKEAGSGVRAQGTSPLERKSRSYFQGALTNQEL